MAFSLLAEWPRFCGSTLIVVSEGTGRIRFRNPDLCLASRGRPKRREGAARRQLQEGERAGEGPDFCPVSAPFMSIQTHYREASCEVGCPETLSEWRQQLVLAAALGPSERTPGHPGATADAGPELPVAPGSAQSRDHYAFCSGGNCRLALLPLYIVPVCPITVGCCAPCGALPCASAHSGRKFDGFPDAIVSQSRALSG